VLPRTCRKSIKLTSSTRILAGQERFRSISRLYYRGANACILCYSITDAQSFAEMGIWLTELRRNLPPDIVLHVVGTKADIVARDPSTREVPFERCIAYVAENLAPGRGSTPPPTASAQTLASSSQPASAEPRSPSSKRSSGFWGQEAGWDACHEISAENGEGVEEVFRVVTRKLVEQNRKMQQALLAATATPALTPGHSDLGYGGPGGGSGGYGDGGEPGGYFDGANPRGSFRVGRDRRSWLFSPGFSPSVSVDRPSGTGADQSRGQEERFDRGRRKCCAN
jgi:GTPase SAR1 family protein